ncbi:hypothetical protein KY328_02585, partial [Candidatus Woesearchaeota archaeon]|nr:hypothetical protein [Candidatus Woesearchaeota archaeon]
MAARYQEQYVSEDTLSEISLLEKGVITDMFLRNGIEPKIEHGIPMYPTTAAWQYIQGVEESLPELEELLTYNDVAFFSGVSKKRLGMRMNYQRRKAKDSDSFCRDIEPYLDKGRVKSLPYGLWLVVAPELEGRLIANFIPPADEVFDPLERLTIGQVAEESGLSVEKLQY